MKSEDDFIGRLALIYRGGFVVDTNTLTVHIEIVWFIGLLIP
jgi:hypothetical protein